MNNCRRKDQAGVMGAMLHACVGMLSIEMGRPTDTACPRERGAWHPRQYVIYRTVMRARVLSTGVYCDTGVLARAADAKNARI